MQRANRVARGSQPSHYPSIYLSRCLRSKLHESSTYRVNGVRITFGWNPAYEDAAKLAAKQAAAEPLTDAEASWWRRRPASGP